MLQLARDLDHPPSLAAALAFALHAGGLRHSYTGSMACLRDLAVELRRLCRDEGFFMWSAVAEIYLGVIGHALGERGARVRMKEGLELFVQTKTRVTAVMMNVLVAEVLNDGDADDEALALLDDAEAEARERSEGFYVPEIWRVRGRIFARQHKRRVRRGGLSPGMELAGAQGARSLELRTALDLDDLLDADGCAAERTECAASTVDDSPSAVDRLEPANAIRSCPLPPSTGAAHVG